MNPANRFCAYRDVGCAAYRIHGNALRRNVSLLYLCVIVTCSTWRQTADTAVRCSSLLLYPGVPYSRIYCNNLFFGSSDGMGVRTISPTVRSPSLRVLVSLAVANRNQHLLKQDFRSGMGACSNGGSKVLDDHHARDITAPMHVHCCLTSVIIILGGRS